MSLTKAREFPSGAANARALRRCPRRGGETMSSSLLRDDRAKIGDRSRETHSGEMEKPQAPLCRAVRYRGSNFFETAGDTLPHDATLTVDSCLCASNRMGAFSTVAINTR